MTGPAKVLVWHAGYGGGNGRAATAVADMLVDRHGRRVRVLSTDVFERHLPKLRGLAAVAYRNAEAFFPDGLETLSGLASKAADDPAVRELVSGGIAGIEAALDAFQPDAVASFHAVPGGIAAELAGRFGYAAVTVLTDVAPGRAWLHPETALFCVAGPDVRQSLASRGVAWERVAVTGVPVPAAVKPSVDRAAARRLVHLDDRPTALIYPSADRGFAARMVPALRTVGVQVVVLAPEGQAPEEAEGEVEYAMGLSLLPASDVAVCSGGGSALWSSPAAGCPLVVVAPVFAQEAANVDQAVNSGVAIVARDVADAAARVQFLVEHPDRSRRMSEDAGAFVRPTAAASVCERVLALIR